ncbi:MAG: hypothetical protein V1690_04035 [Candidatus Moraniibacteriota bacterium]
MEDDKKKDSEEAAEEEKDTKEEMEDEEMFADDEDFGEEDGDTWDRARAWVQDNLRVILSVLIVALIAVGIYNYSKKPATEQPSAVDQIVGEQGVVTEEGLDNQNQNAALEVQPGEKKDQVVVKEEKKEEAKPPVATPAEAKAEKSAEGYTVKAAPGNGLTHLAREALRGYLAANPDAGLTKEHKIYIEDYLQKHVAQGSLRPGDSRMFSDSLVKDSISQAKMLNESQLKNLQKYSARVSNL